MRFFAAVALALFVRHAQAALPDVQRWAYQLQNLDIAEVAAADDFDLIVMDHSATGSGASAWSPEQIDAVRSGGKTSVAYLSVGEAESYRWYWQESWSTDPPAWLGPENPDWAGNYKVRYWDPQWREIVFDYVDLILAQGFAGLYLDIIDAYDYWSLERPGAAADMVDFVSAIRSHASTAGRPDLLIIPQNGEEIIHEASVTAAAVETYLDAIDAVGVESVYHPGPLEEDNPLGPDLQRIAVLGDYRDRGLPILSVEYLRDPALKTAYYATAFTAGFVPFASVRDLDILAPRPDLPAPPGAAWVTGPAVPTPAVASAAVPVLAPDGGGRVAVEVYDLRGRLLERREHDLAGGVGNVVIPRPGAAGPAPAPDGIYPFRLLHDGIVVGRGTAVFLR